jgi:hypothetical protein
MTAQGWRKRQIHDLHSEVDEFEEVMADRILIEEEIAMIEAMIIKSAGDVNAQMGVDLDASLMIAREKLRNLK